jgi:hypothetical protein
LWLGTVLVAGFLLACFHAERGLLGGELRPGNGKLELSNCASDAGSGADQATEQAEENKRGGQPVPLHPPQAAPPKASSPATNKPASPPGEQPLLLLDDEPATNAPAGGADNSRCQVCHLNFMQEKLAVSHARTNIGCATCHGPCDAHIADESWASGGNGTAPDKMFPRLKIYGMCIACHKPEQVFVKVEKHKPFWWAIAFQEQVCTDCHGRHHMVTRKCQWK